MRLALLLIAVTGAIGLGFVSPPIALLSHVAFSLSRPDLLAWSTLPFGVALASLALLNSIRMLGNLANIFTNPFTGLLLLQQIPIGLSVFSAVSLALSMPYYTRYLKIVLMALLIPMMIANETWFRRLMFTIVFSMGLVAVKLGLFSLVYGGASLRRGIGGNISDSNGASLFVAMLIPLAWYSIGLTRTYWVKMTLIGILVCAFATVVAAGSRGNALALACVVGLMVMRTKYKAAGLAGAALLSLPILYMMGDRFASRMATIQTYEEDASSSQRLELWIGGLKAARDYPLLGVGYGEKNWIHVSPRYLGRPNHLVCHNTYIQMLVDCGVPLFLLYVGTLWGAVFWLQRSAARMKALNPDWLPYPYALQGALLVFGLGSTFYSRGDFELTYMLIGAAGSWYLIEKRWLADLTVAQQNAAAVAASPPPAPMSAAMGPLPGTPRFRWTAPPRVR